MSIQLEKKNMFLNSFCQMPEVGLANQFQDEKFFLLLRAHPVTQLFWIFNTVALIIIVFISELFVGQFINPLQLFYFRLFAFCFTFSYALIKFTSWFFNVGLISNFRVLDLDFIPLNYRNITETKIFNVEDITSESKGPFASLFHYGDIYVQTAGAKGNIEFHNVPEPNKAVKIINSLVKENKD